MKKLNYLLSIVPLLFLSACATHTSETKNARVAWASGNVSLAQSEFDNGLKEKESSGDVLVWRLESAAAARANKDFKTSIKNFESAHNDIQKFEDEPDVKLMEETTAIFTNQSYIPYKGYNYDKIMASIYQALNYIETKDFENAAVELKKLENFQVNAESSNARRIERETNILKEAQSKQKKESTYEAGKTLSDPIAKQKFREIYGNDYSSNTSSMQAKGLYVNPFGYWLSGIFFMNKSADNSDKNRAADFMRFAAEVGGNKSELILSDLKTAEDFANGTIQEMPNMTYVIYETGSAPIREQVRIDLPLYIIGRDIPYVGMNFPYLKNVDSFTPDLNISAGGKIAKLETIADMDEIIKREFNDELPLVITKTIVSSAAKAMMHYGVKQAAGKDDWAGLIVDVGMTIYQASMNDADLRTWTTLPKKIRISKIETPENGIINIDGKDINVNSVGTNILYAKRMNAGAPLILRKIDFSGKKAELAEDVIAKDKENKNLKTE